MVRPCFLVIDREYSGSISTRKLVIETAKFNVLTAYSAQEAIDTITRFPQISGAVVDTGTRDMSCDDLVSRLKEINPKAPIIAIGAPGTAHCAGADYQLESFEPARLLDLLRRLEPEQAAAIEKRNEFLDWAVE
jgi:DNA-binding NtrC family response regulator